jgi:hypothetical protein
MAVNPEAIRRADGLASAVAVSVVAAAVPAVVVAAVEAVAAGAVNRIRWPIS